MNVGQDAALNLKSDRAINTNAEEFYREFWIESATISDSSINLKRSIIEKFGIDKFVGKKILEIGVGGEGGLIVLLQQHNEVFGVDVSNAAIRNCKSFGVPAMKANMDKERLPFDDEHFEYIIAFEVFEHFSNPQFALEELKRLLKPGGNLLISTPSPFIYHWPRLFYPGLFESSAFQEFLMVNGFSVDRVANWYVRFIEKINMPDDKKVWCWYWNCCKLGNNDASVFFKNGICFWEQKNEFGLRLRPLEALELFRKSFELDPANFRYKLFFTHALLYRALNGDSSEFLPLFTEIDNNFELAPKQNRDEYVSTFCKIILEAHKLGIKIVEEDELLRVVTKARSFIELNTYLTEAGF